MIECNCTHCSRKVYLLWFVPREHLNITEQLASLPTYLFNKHVIEHHFCPECGCAPLATGENRGKMTAAINIRCLEDVDLATVKRVPWDGRSA